MEPASEGHNELVCPCPTQCCEMLRGERAVCQADRGALGSAAARDQHKVSSLNASRVFVLRIRPMARTSDTKAQKPAGLVNTPPKGSRGE